MDLTNRTLVELTQLTPEENDWEETGSMRVHDQAFSMLVSNTFRQMSETDEQFKQAINTLSNSPLFSSSPVALLQLQNYLGEYSNYVSLISTLARKGVSTIETLEKAQ